MNYKSLVESSLQQAGIVIDGPDPWDIQVKNPHFYQKVALQGTLGLGETYMDGWWDCSSLDQFAYRTAHINLQDSVLSKSRNFLQWLLTVFVNLQSKERAFIVGKKHYDIGNDLFEFMLDKRLTYSCGYWKNSNNLDAAQEAKLELICQKLYLKPGMRILDIGCGWGSFSKYAAEKHGVSVVGITVSKNQLELGRRLCHGFPIELRLQDYRDLKNETFDRIVSIGQMEHVGYKNYLTYMQIVKSCLNKEGLFLLHTIGNDVSLHTLDPWIAKHIFPNGQIPSIKQLIPSTEGLFVMEDWHNFGCYYDPTLMAWHANFKNHWNVLKNHYDERFYRMWSFYLLCCAGIFRARKLQLWQVIFSPHGVPHGYQSIR
jgi:cyclopropane-fatty-acyl-phospholipid synthase